MPQAFARPRLVHLGCLVFLALLTRAGPVAGQSDEVVALIGGLQHAEASYRVAAAARLAALGSQRLSVAERENLATAVPALAELVHDQSPRVRLAAVQALGLLGRSGQGLAAPLVAGLA